MVLFGFGDVTVFDALKGPQKERQQIRTSKERSLKFPFKGSRRDVGWPLSQEVFTRQTQIYLEAKPPMGLIVLISKGAANNPSFWIVSPNAVK